MTRSSSPVLRRRIAVAPRISHGALTSLLLICLVAPATLDAHAVVFPKSSTTGAYEKYVLRVPNERDVPTVRVEIRFPADVRVVSFSDVAGWRLEVLTDSAKRITGAAWTGVLPKERFIEFPFVAVNPNESTSVRWPTYQTYEGGERIEWTGAESSKTPASATEIDGSSTASSPLLAPLTLAISALVLSLISLGIALRPGRTG
jgi:uncharacterized protein YcnI